MSSSQNFLYSLSLGNQTIIGCSLNIPLDGPIFAVPALNILVGGLILTLVQGNHINSGYDSAQVLISGYDKVCKALKHKAYWVFGL